MLAQHHVQQSEVAGALIGVQCCLYGLPPHEAPFMIAETRFLLIYHMLPADTHVTICIL